MFAIQNGLLVAEIEQLQTWAEAQGFTCAQLTGLPESYELEGVGTLTGFQVLELFQNAATQEGAIPENVQAFTNAVTAAFWACYGAVFAEILGVTPEEFVNNYLPKTTIEAAMDVLTASAEEAPTMAELYAGEMGLSPKAFYTGGELVYTSAGLADVAKAVEEALLENQGATANEEAAAIEAPVEESVLEPVLASTESAIEAETLPAPITAETLPAPVEVQMTTIEGGQHAFLQALGSTAAAQANIAETQLLTARTQAQMAETLAAQIAVMQQLSELLRTQAVVG